MIAAHQTMLAPQGAPLPFDAEVEYVEATGTQYIDTGISPGNNDLDFSIVAKNNSTGSYTPFFGCREDTGGGVYVATSYSAFIRGNNNGELRADIANSGSAVVIPLRNAATYRIDWDSQTKTITATNTSSGVANTATANAKASNALSFALFGVNTGGTIAGGAYARIYAATFTKSGALVRDFRPVRVGTAGYLYDAVSGTLFGSGDLTPGPDKT